MAGHRFGHAARERRLIVFTHDVEQRLQRILIIVAPGGQIERGAIAAVVPGKAEVATLEGATGQCGRRGQAAAAGIGLVDAEGVGGVGELLAAGQAQ
jgi:hypothetical protein